MITNNMSEHERNAHDYKVSTFFSNAREYGFKEAWDMDKWATETKLKGNYPLLYRAHTEGKNLVRNAIGRTKEKYESADTLIDQIGFSGVMGIEAGLSPLMYFAGAIKGLCTRDEINNDSGLESELNMENQGNH